MLWLVCMYLTVGTPVTYCEMLEDELSEAGGMEAGPAGSGLTVVSTPLTSLHLDTAAWAPLIVPHISLLNIQ